MPHVFITGDKHGDYKSVEEFCLKWNTSKDDLLIVLGDNGVNYYGPHKDKRLKNYLASLPISFFMIKGNHDQRPSLKLYHGDVDRHSLVKGTYLVEEDYPSLLFSMIHGQYSFLTNNGWKQAYVMGGAYSADKWFRLDMQMRGYKGYRWFADEQMTESEMKDALDYIQTVKPEIILTHTCPFVYIPQDMFITNVNQGTVDKTMEYFFDQVDAAIDYKRWYCGHWHTDRTTNKVRFMYNDIILLE